MSKFMLVMVAGCVVFASPLAAEAGYTGYSGAPGSRGSCASSCHGGSGGSITIEGFPTSYEPGQTYVVWLRHSGGSSIRNFNGSVRVGTGSQTAGTITAGLNTSTYSATGEPNGVHLSSSRKDSCSFSWTAPASGVGDVRLYIAGLQGGYSGQNSDLVLVSGQGTGIEERGVEALNELSIRAVPSLVTRTLVLRLATPDGRQAAAFIVNSAGRIVARTQVPASAGPVRKLLWPLDAHGGGLAAGIYVAALVVEGEYTSTRFTVSAD